jgi:ligand-binding sensor domain-containing protein
LREGDSWTRFGVEEGLCHEVIRTLAQDQDDRLWIATTVCPTTVSS